MYVAVHTSDLMFLLPSDVPFFGCNTIWSSIYQLLFIHSVVFHSLQPHGLQHARLPYPLPFPGACSNSCPSSWWCHQTISSSVIPFSSHLQSFPASGSFLMSQFFPSGGQSIGASASASVLPMNIQAWFPLGWTGGISLKSKGFSRAFFSTMVLTHQFLGLPGSSVHGIIQSWILEWVAIPFFRGSSWPRDRTQISWFQTDSLPSKPVEKSLKICMRLKCTVGGSMALVITEYFKLRELNRYLPPLHLRLPLLEN